jgi:iron complex outermembrane recepter protein
VAELAPAAAAPSGTDGPSWDHRATRRGWARAVLALVAIGGAMALGPAAVLGAEEGATLWGVVVAPDDSRVPGAALVLVRREGGGRQTATGALGVYRVSGLAPGTWDMTARSPGFTPAVAEAIVLAPGEVCQLDLRLTIAAMTEGITVLSSPAPDSVEAPRIRESGARDVGQALGAMPGLWSLRKGGIATDVVLRGLQSRDLNVLVDGDRVLGACPNHMDPPPFHVDFAEVERIEVSKGPFDVRNPGSLGGVVNVVTRDPGPGLHASPSVSLGSFGYLDPAGTVSWGGEHASALGGFSWRSARADRDGDGLRFTERANYRPEAQDTRAFRVGTGWARVVYTPSASTKLEASYTRQQASHLFYPYLQMDAVWDDTDRASVRFEIRRPPKRTITLVTAQAYLTGVHHWMTDAERTSSVNAPRGWSMGTLAHALTWGGKVGGRIGRTTGGIELYRRYWDAKTELAAMDYSPQPSLPGVTVDVLGAYADYSRILGDRVLLETGARFDVGWSAASEQNADTDPAFAYLGTRSRSRRDDLASGKLRVSWRPGRGLQLSLGVGYTARVPEPNERYFSLKRMGADWVGNPSLRPSRNTGLDAAVAWRGSRASLRASVFASRIADFITVREVERQNPVPGVANTRARTWTNVDATLAGAEASFSLAAMSHVFLSGDVSWVRGSQEPRPEEGILSRSLPEMPPIRMSLGLRYDDGRVFAAADLVGVGRQDRVNPDLSEEPTPGYGVLGGALGLRRGRLALTLGATNLLDRTYAPHLSYQRDPFRTGGRVFDPGRSLYLNLSARL